MEKMDDKGVARTLRTLTMSGVYAHLMGITTTVLLLHYMGTDANFLLKMFGTAAGLVWLVAFSKIVRKLKMTKGFVSHHRRLPKDAYELERYINER